MALLPASRSRSGSCPVFSRCGPRPGRPQFCLLSNAAGYTAYQQQQKRWGRRQQQQQPVLANICCGKNNNMRSLAGDDTTQLHREVLRLREQNAALFKERDELLAENAEQRCRLATLAQMQKEQLNVITSSSAAQHENLEQITALENENTVLRRQLVNLGEALCTPGSGKDKHVKVNALLASQLSAAHAEVTKLRSVIKSQLRAAGFAQDGIGQAMKTIGKGAEVFATDPNDITVQEAALDSLLAKGRRRVHAAREFVWDAVAALKDLVDQTFERMGRLVKSDVSTRQKVAYVQELHGLVISQLEPGLKAYNDLVSLHNELESLKAVVFDPKRNNPYCPCRPRRMVLEDDLDHMQKQLKEANEALRSARTQLIKLEMENLANYVQEKCAPPSALLPSDVHNGGPRSSLPLANGVYPSQPQPFSGVGTVGSQRLENAADSEESMEDLLRRAQKEHDAAKVQEAIAALKDEVEMLKDRTMMEEVQRAQPTGYLAEELFSQGLVVAQLVKQMVQATGRLSEVLAGSNFAGTEGRRLRACSQKLDHVAKDITTGKVSLENAVTRAATLLNSLNLANISGNLNSEDVELLKKIEEQRVKMRRISKDIQQMAALHTSGSFCF